MQVGVLYFLGAICVISSWSHVGNFQQIMSLIFIIDGQLRTCVPNYEVDYFKTRRQLLVQFVLVNMIPALLSMVNCVIIREHEYSVKVFTTCFWVLCYSPICMTTFKEFQFFNLLLIIKSKLLLVNMQLEKLGNASAAQLRVPQRIVTPLFVKVKSVSKTALTPLPSPKEVEEQIPSEVSSEALQQLMLIYSNACDAVELLMKCFSWFLLCLTVVIFMSITVETYNVFVIFLMKLNINNYQLTLLLSWIVTEICVLILNVNICSDTNDVVVAISGKCCSLINKIIFHYSCVAPDRCCIKSI